MSATPPELVAAIEKATLAEHMRIGADAFKTGPVYTAFKDRIGRSTCYRIVDQYIASGRCGVHMGEEIRKAAGRRVKAPAAAAEADGVDILPPVTTPADIAGQSPMQLVERLQACMDAADRVMQHAQKEGKITNAGLLLKAVSAQRACLHTAASMLDTMHRVQNIERFHKAVVDVIARLHPAEAEILVRELRGAIGDWRPT